MTTNSIDWPHHLDRTSPHERERTKKFKIGLRPTINELDKELEERIDVDDWRLSTAAQHQKRNPKYPYANENPDDPGAVVRWTKDGDQYAVGCDYYTDLRDNIRTILKYLQEKRKMEGRHVKTGQSEFATAQLPPGEEETEIAAKASPYEVLGLSEGADPEVVEAAAKKLKAKYHPDGGGDKEKFMEVVDAEKEILS